ncbi:MAG: HvfC/BufC family peptide modification chaperone [bacterium]
MRTSLKDAQQGLVDALDPACSSTSRDRIERMIAGSGRDQRIKRLNVYRHSVTAMHQRALEQVFPVCMKILGEAAFNAYARDYSYYHLDANPDLNVFGKAFSRYIGTALAVRGMQEGLEYLPELAELEYAWHSAYYAKDDPDFDFERYAALLHASMNFRFTSSHALVLFESEFPILSIWEHHHRGHSPKTISALPDQECLVVYRQDYQPSISRVDTDTYLILKAIQDGLSIAELASDTDLSTGLRLLPELVQRGWLTGVKDV